MPVKEGDPAKKDDFNPGNYEVGTSRGTWTADGKGVNTGKNGSKGSESKNKGGCP